MNETDLRRLAERLMSELAHVRNLYEAATSGDESDMRHLTLQMSEALITQARQLLYDVDA